MDYRNKRHWELHATITEALAVCGFSPTILNELLAIERSMPHTVIGVIPATVPATELETMRNDKVTN